MGWRWRGLKKEHELGHGGLEGGLKSGHDLGHEGLEVDGTKTRLYFSLWELGLWERN